jgi:hypothetical protein
MFLPDEVRARLALDDDGLITAQIADRRARLGLVDTRAQRLEVRADDDGTRSLTGYATTWDTYYDVAGGPPYGWSETIVRGAATKSLAERDDVRFLINHDGLPQARARGLAIDTMTLTPDELGLRVDIPSLDERNPRVVELLSAIDRGDVDQMSFAFYVVRQEWNAEYTERRILELRLVDVSAVTYPANSATIIAARAAHHSLTVKRGGLPLSLAIAQASALG